MLFEPLGNSTIVGCRHGHTHTSECGGSAGGRAGGSQETAVCVLCVFCFGHIARFFIILLYRGVC